VAFERLKPGIYDSGLLNTGPMLYRLRMAIILVQFLKRNQKSIHNSG